jgi:uncharacterized protein (DUF608 family)
MSRDICGISRFSVTDDDLEDNFKPFVYRGSKTKEISFPLGGIGSGCIGLAGNGRLIDWEIFNKPNKGSTNGFSHFAIKAEAEEKVLDTRVLNGDLMPPYSGEIGKPSFQSFGFGPTRDYMAGVPHFRKWEFEGEYPIAKLRFNDDKFPGDVQMTAFNPYIPLNDVDSSIPSAFFEIQIRNTAKQMVTYTVCLSVQNPLQKDTTMNTYGKEGRVHFIKMTSKRFKEDDPEFGDLTIATDATDVSYQEYWFRGRWFDNLQIYWRDLSSPGRFRNRRYPETAARIQAYPGVQDHCLLAAHVQVKPEETGRARFVISWNFPNCYNYWKLEGEGCKCKPKIWKNYYATLFKDSTRSAIYSLEKWDRLYEETMEFKDALFSSTLPPFVLDAISANLSILKTPTVLRLEDGSFYGFEGCHPCSGCCEGSCTHVWNYAYVLPFLFPKLERSMRDMDFRYNQRADGRMSFRLQLPLSRGRWEFRACADGQFGGVVKAYRDWKISGDDSWLRSNWEAIKKSIEYAWAETNEDRWDMDRDGVLEGRQHHTLDMELFGPNSWLTGFYLAALKAGAEMAEHFGEADRAKEYSELFEKGKRWVDRNLFNGEYYHQLIDLRDRAILERFIREDPNVEDTYWDSEHGEIKYQIAEGCGIDQVLAQWHANICGLGEIFDKAQTRKALRSIFKYNFKKSMRDFFNPCRIFSLDDEAGAVICEWPQGRYKPAIPVPYAEETMNGFEYASAIHMIQEGLMDEGLQIVKAIRERYDGEKRNPWNEFECGSNYARSMASYALLLALSGFEFDLVKRHIGFNPPRLEDGKFRCFWSVGTGWGTFEVKLNSVMIRVQYGKLEVKTLRFPFLKGREVASVSIGEDVVEFENCDGEITLSRSVLIEKGEELVIQFDQPNAARPLV